MYMQSELGIGDGVQITNNIEFCDSVRDRHTYK